MRLNKDTLPEFMERSDSLGGASSDVCKAFWRDMLYEPSCALDAQVEPTSLRYLEQQMALYEEISGHQYKDVRDEFTPGVAVQHLLQAPNACNYTTPSVAAKHYVAMGMLIEQLGLVSGMRVLELGSGWGFSQELLAQCGLESVGIDANPDFVATSNARLLRLGFGERVRQLTFENLSLEALGQFDAIISYEAFHHAVRPHVVLERVIDCLKPGGVLALAAEPFNNYYATWGLRLDCTSIYCIRKFGWFESGWSVEYMADLFGRNGLEATFVDKKQSELTTFLFGRRSNVRRGFQLQMWRGDCKRDFFVSAQHVFSKGQGRISLLVPARTEQIKLKFVNRSTGALHISIGLNGDFRTLEQPTGCGVMIWGVKAHEQDSDSLLEVRSELFCPQSQGINSDTRNLGIDIESIEYLEMSK